MSASNTPAYRSTGTVRLAPSTNQAVAPSGLGPCNVRTPGSPLTRSLCTAFLAGGVSPPVLPCVGDAAPPLRSRVNALRSRPQEASSPGVRDAMLAVATRVAERDGREGGSPRDGGGGGSLEGSHSGAADSTPPAEEQPRPQVLAATLCASPTKSGSRRLWVPDNVASHCFSCDKRFVLLFRRRHHCRVCGRIFCAACTQYRLPASCASVRRPAQSIRVLQASELLVRACRGCLVEKGAAAPAADAGE
jgi:hypothetical protein